MSRKPNIVREESLLTLKELIKRKSNLNCQSFPDIMELQYQIRKNTQEYLSTPTLSRFFGLVKNGFKPSVDTLNILSRFVNYNSFEEFELLNNDQRAQRSKTSPAVQLILSIFSRIETVHPEERGLTQVLRNIHKIIDNDRELRSAIYPFMAASDFGRKYFFEQFVNLNALNGHYGDGLKHYLAYTIERSQQFFAYNLLCYRYFLTGDLNSFNYFYNKLADFDLNEIKTFHCHNIGRFLAVKILRKAIDKEDVDPGSLMDTAVKARCVCNNCHAPFWIKYFIAIAFIITQEYDKAWALLHNLQLDESNLPPNFDSGFITQFDLLKLYCGYFTGKIAPHKARALLDEIKNRPFFFLSEDYFSIFVYLLEMHIYPSKSSRKNCGQRLKSLIEKTGFVHFLSLTEDVEEDVLSYAINDN